MSMNRRSFLATSAATLAAANIQPTFGADGPLTDLRVGFIGVGNQGMGLLKRFLAADLGTVVSVCDVNKGSYGYKEESHFYGREPARDMVNAYYAKHRSKGSDNTCTATANFEDVLARDDVDAVIIVLPDHWHSQATIAAAEAGKQIYCEKPLSLTVADGRAMVDAVKKNNVLLQTGSHERSNPVSAFVCEKVKAGAIGKVKRVVTKVGYNNKVGPGPGWTPEPVPGTFDYNRWLGPAADVPYHHDRCLYRFRFNYDYSGGQITNFGAHSNDMAHWGLDKDLASPVSIECLNAEFLPEGSLFNTATVTKYRCLYDDGVELLCESGDEKVQVRFESDDAWIQTGYAGTTASDPALLEGLPKKPKGVDDPHTSHMRNFVLAVKGEAELAAPVDVGNASAVLCHLANVVIRRFPEHGQQVLDWDGKAERFTNNEDANAMLSRPTRDWS